MEGLFIFGAGCFGLVIGWVTYRTLRRSETTGLSDIATVIGAVGGAAITGLFSPGTPAFGAYGIGLALGFLSYFLVFIKIMGIDKIREDPNLLDLLGNESVEAVEFEGSRPRRIVKKVASGG